MSSEYFEADEFSYLENNRGIIRDALHHAFRCLNKNLDQLQLDEEGHCKEISTSGCEYKIFWPREFKQIRNVRGISDSEIIDELRGELQGPYRSSPASLKQQVRSPRSRGLLSVKSNFSMPLSSSSRSGPSSPTTSPQLLDSDMTASTVRDTPVSALPSPPPVNRDMPTTEPNLSSLPASFLPPAPPSAGQVEQPPSRPPALTTASATAASLSDGVHTTTAVSSGDPAISIHQLPKNSLFSARKKLIIRIIPHSYKLTLKPFIQSYAEYMTFNPRSYICQIFGIIRINVRGSRSIMSIKNPSDYIYVMVTNQVYPRLSHNVMDVFLLNGNKREAIAQARDYKSDADFKLDHELAMKPPQRKEVLRQLEMDIDFLKSANLCNYSLMYAMTERLPGHDSKLPGAEYGPDPDYAISIEHKLTLRTRHDIPYGVLGPAAQLIPVPLSNYENPNREYYFSIVDLELPDDGAKNSQHMSSSLYRLFSDRSMTSSNGVDRKAADYASHFMEFMKNKVMPNYSLSDSEGDDNDDDNEDGDFESEVEAFDEMNDL